MNIFNLFVSVPDYGELILNRFVKRPMVVFSCFRPRLRGTNLKLNSNTSSWWRKCCTVSVPDYGELILNGEIKLDHVGEICEFPSPITGN